MTKRYIPESAVRELVKKHAPCAALEPTVDDVIDDIEALLATAAPQSAPEPEGLKKAAANAEQALLDILYYDGPFNAPLDDLKLVNRADDARQKLRQALVQPAAAETWRPRRRAC